jgi:hypothetical protein
LLYGNASAIVRFGSPVIESNHFGSTCSFVFELGFSPQKTQTLCISVVCQVHNQFDLGVQREVHGFWLDVVILEWPHSSSPSYALETFSRNRTDQARNRPVAVIPATLDRQPSTVAQSRNRAKSVRRSASVGRPTGRQYPLTTCFDK